MSLTLSTSIITKSVIARFVVSTPVLLRMQCPWMWTQCHWVFPPTFQWSAASHNPSTQLHIPEEPNPHQIFAYSTFREVMSAE